MCEVLVGRIGICAVENVGDRSGRKANNGAGEHAEEDAEGYPGSSRAGKRPQDIYEERRNDLCHDVHVESTGVVAEEGKCESAEGRGAVHDHEHEVCLQRCGRGVRYCDLCVSTTPCA